MSNITRRAVLRDAPAAAEGNSDAVAIIGRHLVGICDEIDAQQTLMFAMRRAGDEAAASAASRRDEFLQDREHLLFDAVLAMQASSAEGALRQLEIAACEVGVIEVSSKEDEDHINDRLLLIQSALASVHKVFAKMAGLHADELGGRIFMPAARYISLPDLQPIATSDERGAA